MPTRCSATGMAFGRAGGRDLVAAFDGGLVTSESGALLLGATDQAIRLIERIARERGLTLLFTEHDMEVVFAIAHRITVLHQGLVIADGVPDEVRRHPDVRRVYLGERR